MLIFVPRWMGSYSTRFYTEGSYVKKGQAMFQLDQRQAQAAVEQAQGKLERAAQPGAGADRRETVYAARGAEGRQPSRTR